MDTQVIHGVYRDFMNLPFVIGYSISGIIVYYGKEVKGFSVGDHVVSILSLDMGGGCTSYVVQKFYSVVHKPANLSFEVASSLLEPGLLAYSALHYKFNLHGGDSILVLNGASCSGQIAIQLAISREAKILTTISHPKHTQVIHSTKGIAKVIDLQKENLTSSIMDETGGVGVDLVLDNDDNNVETNDIIKILAPNGCWATSKNIQLDPPQTRTLTLKGASVAFLQIHSWTLFNTQQGRLLHILQDIMSKAENQILEPKMLNRFRFDQISEALALLNDNEIVSVVMQPTI